MNRYHLLVAWRCCVILFFVALLGAAEHLWGTAP